MRRLYIEWLHFKYGIDREKICPIPNGANIDFFYPQGGNACKVELGFDRFDKIVGYVGALASLRNLDDLIRCIWKIQDIGHVGLVLVGSGPDRDMLESLVRLLGLEKHVVFAGAIPYHEVPKYMNTFDVALDFTLVPMRVNDNTLYGSYSQKIPQYLSCGLPVVAWDTPDTQFLKQHEIGDTIPVGNMGSLAPVIKRLLAMDGSRYEQLHSRARAYAEAHFSSQVLAARRIAFWQSAFATQIRR